MAMKDPDAARLFAGVAQELEEAHRLADAEGGALPAHYAALLAQIEHALPQVHRLYAQYLAQLEAPTMPARALKGTAGPARTRSSRPPTQSDIHTAIHRLRRGFYEMVHPLEVIGKWPPDGWTGQSSAPSTARQGTAARGIAKWPPDGF